MKGVDGRGEVVSKDDMMGEKKGGGNRCGVWIRYRLMLGVVFGVMVGLSIRDVGRNR